MLNVIFSPQNIDLYHYEYRDTNSKCLIDITEYKTKIVALSILAGILSPLLLFIGGYLIASNLLAAHYKLKKINAIENQTRILKINDEAINAFFGDQRRVPLENTGGIQNGGRTCYLNALIQGVKSIPYFWNYLDPEKHVLRQYLDEQEETYNKRLMLQETIKKLLLASFKEETVSAEQINDFRMNLRNYDPSFISEDGGEDSAEVWGKLSYLLNIPEVSLINSSLFVFNNQIGLSSSDMMDLQLLLDNEKLKKISPILAFGINQDGDHIVNAPPTLKIKSANEASTLHYKLVSVLSTNGHTTVHVKDKDEWVFFDDTIVKKVYEPDEDKKLTAFLIFYQLAL